MDELLIEDKKYISSKRAAKMTGYAKDYIGQLCREGRVPARLVGRSWYVLETAIQDHRFGTTDIQPKENVHITTEPTISSTWESPRYEASIDEFLPSVNRLRVHTDSVEENSEEFKASERLQDTWKTWFDRVADTETAVPVIEKAEIMEKIEEEKPVEDEVDIPIHTIYELPQNEPEKQSIRQVKQRGKRVIVRAIQVSSILFAIIMASIAMIGSGYLDKYISINQVSVISGILIYNK